LKVYWIPRRLSSDSTFLWFIYTVCFLSLQAVVWQDWWTKWLFQCNDLTRIFPSLFATSRATSFSLYTLRSYCLSLNTSLFCHHHRCVTLNNSWAISHTFQLSFSFYRRIYLIHPPEDIPIRVHAQCSVFNARETLLNAQDIGAGGFHQHLSLPPSFYWKIYIAWFFYYCT